MHKCSIVAGEKSKYDSDHKQYTAPRRVAEGDLRGTSSNRNKLGDPANSLNELLFGKIPAYLLSESLG